MHAAHNVIVLQAGSIQYQGSIEEIKKQGYEMLADHGTDQPTISPMLREPMSYASDDAPEEEITEAALAKESLGLTPYSFYSRMVGRLGFTFAMVRAVFLDISNVIHVHVKSLIVFYSVLRLGLQVPVSSVFFVTGADHVTLSDLSSTMGR